MKLAPIILHIETATEVCSVAVSRGNEVIFSRLEAEGPSHAKQLGVFVYDAVKFLRVGNEKLDAVSVSCGPGSYTGLRIGVSEAKGLCFGLNIPLIAIDTLKIMASQIVKRMECDGDTLLCPMIDARRMEVYDAIYNRNLQQMRAVSADIIENDSFAEQLDTHKVMFFGNGSEKCKEKILHENAVFVSGIYPQAIDMIDLATELYEEGVFVDTAYFEPFYLKDFVATVPKNKVINQQ